MSQQVYILFCKNPLIRNKVDEDFEDQFVAAQENGFEVLLFNFEDLISSNNFSITIQHIERQIELANMIYRGWMLTPNQYETLYQFLLSKNYKLINSPEEYQNCHYLPDSLKYIKQLTPKTVWETACFVENVSNEDKLRQSINNLLKLRDKYLNEGIVIREFIELNELTIHTKSGMPLTEEYRLFFCNKKLIGIYDYWEEGDYSFSKLDTIKFEKIALHVESNFFSMDIARQKNGEFVIIELGDGQVAGLPDKANRNEFYKQLKYGYMNIDEVR
ncbi:MAG: ATP-grasp domain-containing protein [Bacteroidetes bacterium]|nr:ATP-grasp domain-containing protein [Bacteroidota bacterium]